MSMRQTRIPAQYRQFAMATHVNDLAHKPLKANALLVSAKGDFESCGHCCVTDMMLVLLTLRMLHAYSRRLTWRTRRR